MRCKHLNKERKYNERRKKKNDAILNFVNIHESIYSRCWYRVVVQQYSGNLIAIQT